MLFFFFFLFVFKRPERYSVLEFLRFTVWFHRAKRLNCKTEIGHQPREDASDSTCGTDDENDDSTFLREDGRTAYECQYCRYLLSIQSCNSVDSLGKTKSRGQCTVGHVTHNRPSMFKRNYFEIILYAHKFELGTTRVVCKSNVNEQTGRLTKGLAFYEFSVLYLIDV